MKTRTNQPIFKDDGTPFTDNQLDSDIAQKGGTKLYRHEITFDTDNFYGVVIINNSSIGYDDESDMEDLAQDILENGRYAYNNEDGYKGCVTASYYDGVDGVVVVYLDGLERTMKVINTQSLTYLNDIVTEL